MTSAVVTTARDPDEYFGWWVKHHLKYFSWVYVFLDTDPLPHVNIPILPRLTVLPGVEKVKQNSPSSVMDRQEANTSYAIQLALNKGYKWLVHIDSDELIFTGGRAFSKVIAQYSQYHIVTMTNHESLIIDDVNKNYFLNPYFKDGNSNKQKFLAYGNGKAAVQLSQDMNISAFGVHDFKVRGKRVKSTNIDMPCILHYPNATYENWLKKYVALGNFSDWWYDDKDEPIELEFHLRSRDVVQECLKINDFTKAYLFYQSRVVNDKSVLNKPGILKIEV